MNVKLVGTEGQLCVHINDLFKVVTLVAYTLFHTNNCHYADHFLNYLFKLVLDLRRKLQLVLV